MANFNKVILAGNATRDPQLSYLPSQTPVCQCGIAVNHKWKSQDGTQRDEALFVDFKIFGKQAETFNQYVTKGSPVLLEGRLQLEQWEAQDGTKRSKHVVNVQSFQFLGGKRQAPQQGSPAPKPQGGMPDDEVPFD